MYTAVCIGVLLATVCPAIVGVSRHAGSTDPTLKFNIDGLDGLHYKRFIATAPDEENSAHFKLSTGYPVTARSKRAINLLIGSGLVILKRIRAVRSLLRGAEYFRTEKGVSIFKKSGGLQHALHDFTLAKPVNVQRVDAEDGVVTMMGQVGDTMLALKFSNAINDAVLVIGRIRRQSTETTGGNVIEISGNTKTKYIIQYMRD